MIAAARRVPEDAEDAAFFAQPIGVKVKRRKVIGPGLDYLGRNFSRHIHGPVSRFAWQRDVVVDDLPNCHGNHIVCGAAITNDFKRSVPG